MDRRWLLTRAYTILRQRFASLANGNIKDTHVDVPHVQMPI